MRWCRAPRNPRGAVVGDIRCRRCRAGPGKGGTRQRPPDGPLARARKTATPDTNWNIIAYPSTSWAKQVFPDDPEDVAIAKLADAIFAAWRVDKDGAVAN
jgi:leucyl aminopeptidase (aminopeptidase T)